MIVLDTSALVAIINHEPERIALWQDPRVGRARGSDAGKRKHRLAVTPEGQRNHDLALSLSKGGPRAPSVLRQAQHGVGGLGKRGPLRPLPRVNTLARRYDARVQVGF